MIPIPLNQTKRNTIRRKSVKKTGKMTCQTHCQVILIRLTTVTTDTSDKTNGHRKKDSIKLCAWLTKTFLTTGYKSNIIRFKLDEDPLKRRIYFLTYVELLLMIFSQYKETCEVLLDYPKIGGENSKEFIKIAIRNLLRANIDVHSRRLIAELPGDGIKFY